MCVHAEAAPAERMRLAGGHTARRQLDSSSESVERTQTLGSDVSVFACDPFPGCDVLGSENLMEASGLIPQPSHDTALRQTRPAHLHGAGSEGTAFRGAVPPCPCVWVGLVNSPHLQRGGRGLSLLGGQEEQECPVHHPCPPVDRTRTP